MLKRFLEWIKIKERLDKQAHEPPLINEGDFWWCGLGENVGSEIGGKSKDFTRPVVVLKKFGRLSFLGIPTTTKPKEGSWYVLFVHQGVRETAVLSQARMFSYKRLHSKIGTLDDADLRKIKEAYARLFI